MLGVLRFFVALFGLRNSSLHFRIPRDLDPGCDETMPKAYEEGNGRGIGRMSTEFPQFLCISNLNWDFWSPKSVPFYDAHSAEWTAGS
jgi:hypothetical protein